MHYPRKSYGSTTHDYLGFYLAVNKLIMPCTLSVISSLTAKKYKKKKETNKMKILLVC